MRETFSSLLLTTQNYISDASATTTSGLSATDTFLKKEINKAARLIFSKLRNYRTQSVDKTADTVEDQQYYHYPPGVKNIHGVTVTISSVAYPLTVVESQRTWDILNQLDFSGNAIPQFIFPRRDDYGIWPTPAADGNTITFKAHYIPKDMTIADYTTGTVTSVQNDATITGSGTTFTSAMVGRWFKADSDKDWYRITTYTSATSIELESVFEGSAVSGDTYIIGESPEIPEELHELIPYKAAASYLAGPRRSPEKAQAYLNYFWTGDFDNNARRGSLARGGLLGAMADYGAIGRSNSRIVRRNKRQSSRFDEIWSSTLE